MWRLLRIRKDKVMLLAALGLAVCAGLAAAGYWYFVSPTWLTVAVGPRDGAEERLIRAYAEALAAEKRDIRLRVVAYDGVKESAEALRERKADLAVVRPDVLLPPNGATVAILREEAVILAVPEAKPEPKPAGKGKGKAAEKEPDKPETVDVDGLAGKRLGVVSHHQADSPAIASVLAHYELAPPDITLVPLSRGEVADAFASKRIDALAFVAAPATREAGELVRAAAKAVDGKVEVIAVGEADALALKTPALTTVTIPAGSLGGRPKIPDEDTKTLAVSYRLMARTDEDRVVISKVAQHLFQMRSRIAQSAPAIHLMKAPETETATSAALPNHQGAIDYFMREQRTFMDRYGDWIWIGLFAGGGLSSAFAWITQLFVRKRRELVDKVLDRVLCILSEARAADTVAKLDDLALEIDGLVTHAVRHARRRTTGTKTMTALIVAIDSARSAIADRRRDLLDDKAAAAEKAAGEKATGPRLAAGR
ncbi:MAG TPA: TAXI family TRAP transporter solute-binding subunit [Beijerinckiaceae bacterium]|jgi:TRAP-type uncharacterized transport system substrate-binding protein